MKILSFGEILWDVYPQEKYIGGAPLNFAAHFIKQGGDAYMLSDLGNDELGHLALEQLNKWGINTEYISVSENKQTGRCVVELDESGIPSYNLLEDVAYDCISCKNIANDFDAFYFGTLALRSKQNRETVLNLLETNSFKEVFVDINIRPPFFSKESILLAFKNATIIKISDEELPIVLNEIFETEYDYSSAVEIISNKFKNFKLIIITRGDKGSFVYDCKEKKSYSTDAIKVEVVSTVGAGDSFSATFLYKYLLGLGIDECLSCATKVSAVVVSKTEAIPEYEVSC